MSHQSGQPIALFPNSDRPLSHDINQALSVHTSRSTGGNKQPIALISVYHDPATVGKTSTSSQSLYVRKLGESLVNLGWQVDMFTRKTHPDDPTIVEHSSACRTIRLLSGSEAPIAKDDLFKSLPQFVAAYEKFQSKEGTNYPLIHTHYWLSAWVGLQLKSRINVQLVHTPHSLGLVKYQTLDHRSSIVDTRLAIEEQILNEADCIVAKTLQEREQLRSQVANPDQLKLINSSTDMDSLRLSSLYRRLLAQSIMDERLWHLPLPTTWETSDSPVQPTPVTVAQPLTLAS